MYISVLLNIFTFSCNATFSSAKLKLCSHYTPHIPPPSVLPSTTVLLSLWVWLIQVPHRVESYSTVLLWVAYFTNDLMGHPCCSIRQDFLLFMRLNHIPPRGCNTFCLCSHPFIDIQVASTSWILWIIVLWTWAGVFETLLSIPPKVGLWGHMVTLIFCRLTYYFP